MKPDPKVTKEMEWMLLLVARNLKSTPNLPLTLLSGTPSHEWQKSTGAQSNSGKVDRSLEDHQRKYIFVAPVPTKYVKSTHSYVFIT